MEWNAVSFAGVWLLLLVAWLFSERRGRPNLRLVIVGTALQLAFAAFVFVVPLGRRVFLVLNDMVVRVLGSAMAGTEFVFGRLALPPGVTNAQGEESLGFILAFQALPTVVFFASLMGALYYIGLMPWLIRIFARSFTRLLRTSGAESLCTAANIFVGIESAFTIRPHIERMTRSELCTILTAGMATIASSVMALYVFLLRDTFPTIAGHLISASVISAPAALVMSKLLVPEREEPVTLGVDVRPHYERESSFMEAIITGAMGGLRLVAGIVAMLLALLGLIALIDLGLGAAGGRVNALLGWEGNWSLRALFGYAFYPLTVAIGVPPVDAGLVARLIGERVVATEVQAYQDLAGAMQSGALAHPRSAIIAAYALCGFAHFPSLAIFVGGISAIAPSRTKALASVALRALLAATLACLMTGAVAGTVYTGEALVGE
jgi:CNT family concentrative nucleoside transporter